MINLDPNIWKELTGKSDANLLPRNPSKLKLIADQNIPLDIVKDLQKNNIAINSIYDMKLEGYSDESILQIAKKIKRVLLTTDKDFWDEKKHPIQNHFGIFCVESGPQNANNFYLSFVRLYIGFARFVPNEWWAKTKVLLKTDGFTIRKINPGIINETEYKFIGKRILVREIK